MFFRQSLKNEILNFYQWSSFENMTRQIMFTFKLLTTLNSLLDFFTELTFFAIKIFSKLNTNKPA